MVKYEYSLFYDYSSMLMEWIKSQLYLSEYASAEKGGVDVFYSTPARAFAKYVFDTGNGQLKRPLVTFHLNGMEYLRNENILGFQREVSFDLEKQKFIYKKPPLIYRLNYGITVYGKNFLDGEKILFHLMEASSHNERAVEVLNKRWVEFYTDNIRDESNLEPGEIQNITTRHGLDLIVLRAYLPRLNAVREGGNITQTIIIDIEDKLMNKETLITSSVPYFEISDDQNFSFGEDINFKLPQITGGARPYFYSVVGLPDHLEIIQKERSIVGTIDEIGTHNLKYIVTDKNSIGDSDSFNFIISSSLPSVIEHLEINPGDTTTEIDLSWSSPLNLGGDSITYRIDVSSTGDTYEILGDSLINTFYTHTGLSPGDTRFYRVYSKNSSGFSDYISGYATTDSVPLGPINLVISSGGSTEIDLNWESPLYNGGHPILGYKISESSDNISFTTLVAFQIETSYTHSGFNPGTTHFYKVYAINIIGTSLEYVFGSSTTDTTIPDRPQDLSAHHIGDTGVELIWDSPLVTGGISITGYRIDTSRNGDSYTTLSSSHGDTNFNIFGLNFGDTHFYRVYAINIVGTSTEYASTHVVIGQSIDIPSEPRNLFVIPTSQFEISLIWENSLDNGGGFLNYRIDVSSTGDTFTTLVSSQTSTSYTHTGLSSGDTRFYRVYAFNGAGYSDDFVSQNATTFILPSEPHSFLVVSDGINDIDLSWDMPDNNGGDTAITYRIDISSTGDIFTTLVASQENLFYDHSNLNPGDTRFYRVYSINSVGTSLNYVEGNNTTDTTFPNPPNNLSIQVDGDSTLVLSWNSPIEDGGLPITGYRIDVSENNSSFTTLVASQIETFYTHTGLEQIRFYYRVYSINDNDTSLLFSSIDGFPNIDQTIIGSLWLNIDANHISWRPLDNGSTRINSLIVNNEDEAYVWQFRVRPSKSKATSNIGNVPIRQIPDLVLLDFSYDFENDGIIEFSVGTETFQLNLGSSEVTNDLTESYSWGLSGTTLDLAESFFNDVSDLSIEERTPVTLRFLLGGG